MAYVVFALHSNSKKKRATSNFLYSELDLSVNSSEIYGKSRTIGPSPIQNIKN
jgi:hypothetical protein